MTEINEEAHAFEEVETEHESLWVQEAEARYEEIKEGKVDCQSFAEVMRELRENLNFNTLIQIRH